MPWMSAPIFTSMRARSWTWGSQAALPMTVVPGVSAAAISAFSVAITEGSSMNTSVAAQSRGALEHDLALDRRSAPIARKASRCGSRRRRPITSPPGGGMHGTAESAPAAGLRAGRRRGSARRARGRSRRRAPRRRTGRVRWVRASPRATPIAARIASIASTSRMRGTFSTNDLLLGEHARGEDRQRAVLVPGRAQRAGERHAAFDDELLHELRRRPREPTNGALVMRARGKRNSHSLRSSSPSALATCTTPERVAGAGEPRAGHRSRCGQTATDCNRRCTFAATFMALQSRFPPASTRAYTCSRGFRPRAS